MIDKIFSGIYIKINTLYNDIQTFSGCREEIKIDVEKNFTINKMVMNRKDAHKYVDAYFDELVKYEIIKEAK